MRFAPPALGIKFAAITADSQVGFFKGKALQIPCKTLRVLGRKIRKQKKRKKKNNSVVCLILSDVAHV